MKKSQLDAQAMVALDALEAEDPRTPKLLAPILKVVRAHGIREGRADYEGRAGDVARGLQDPDWAWPFGSADDAYINAVGISGITDEIGIPERLWEHVSDAWFAAFKRGYVAAHEADEADEPKRRHSTVRSCRTAAKKKRAAQLDREIAEALRAGQRRKRGRTP